jgi:Ca2+-binding RTX toxin-like protein
VATNVNMDGGDGDDFIELRGGTLSAALATNVAGLSSTGVTGAATYMALGATSNDRNVDVVTVDGGAGNDRIILSGVASATINAGSGNDIVSISMRGVTSVNNYQITLGSGADTIQLGVGSNAANSTDVASTARTDRVTDFQVGDAGDKFEMTNFLNFGLTGYTANSNAFADGHLRLVQSGTDLLLQSDRDGAGATNSFVTIFAISNGYTGGFTAYNFDGFIGNLTLTGIGALNEKLVGATGNDVLSGGDGNDKLMGLAGNDTLDGGNGNDTLTGGAGDDTLIGGAGNDTASYGDAASDVTVSLAIAGVQATGSGNDTLSGIENLTGSLHNDTLTGDTAANILFGGDGDDVLNGGAGADTLFGGNGADKFLFDHGTGQDTVADFVSGSDKLDLSAFGFADFTAVQAATHDVGGNAVIDLGGGDSVTLTGVTSSQLQSGDVILSGSGGQIALQIGTESAHDWAVLADTGYNLNDALTRHFPIHLGPVALPAWEHVL